MSNGARVLARFTVRRSREMEIPGLFSFRVLKRRERRAPNSAQSRYPFARDSIAIVGDAALAQSCPVKMDRKNCRRPYGCRVYCGGGASLTQRKPVCGKSVAGCEFMSSLG